MVIESIEDSELCVPPQGAVGIEEELIVAGSTAELKVVLEAELVTCLVIILDLLLWKVFPHGFHYIREGELEPYPASVDLIGVLHGNVHLRLVSDKSDGVK